MRVDLCRFRAFAGFLREVGHDLVIHGGMGAKSRAAALAHLQPHTWRAAAPGRGHWPVLWRRLRLPGGLALPVSAQSIRLPPSGVRE
jgi:hypothetical protein